MSLSQGQWCSQNLAKNKQTNKQTNKTIGGSTLAYHKSITEIKFV